MTTQSQSQSSPSSSPSLSTSTPTACPKNDLLLRALRGEPVARPPVWMMRQAGRYLPGFRALRAKHSFFERCRNPQIAAEITVMPVDEVGVDAAILFSDILVVPQAMGMDVDMREGEGPVLPSPIRTVDDGQRIRVPDVQDSLHYVFDAVRACRQALADRVPLIGFAGAPWTVFCYMVEGRGSKNFDAARMLCVQQPALAHRVLRMLTDTTIAYLREQVNAGVHCVQLFDSWAGLLGPEDFRTLSLPYIREIVAALRDCCPVIVFAKGAWYALSDLAATGAHALGLDWTIDAAFARAQIGPHTTLQGNLDPVHLFASPQEIRRTTHAMMRSFGVSRYIVNLGHGILPNTPVDHARAFVEAVCEAWHEGSHG
jgi:uroporphyrinogen decarboxylase